MNTIKLLPRYVNIMLTAMIIGSCNISGNLENSQEDMLLDSTAASKGWTNVATEGDDLLYGGENGFIINGLGGFDTIVGGAGNDRLRGNDDGDTIYAGNGNDEVWGDAGNDLLYDQANGADRGSGNDTFIPGSGNDTVWIRPSGGSNIIQLESGNDKIYLDCYCSAFDWVETIVTIAGTNPSGLKELTVWDRDDGNATGIYHVRTFPAYGHWWYEYQVKTGSSRMYKITLQDATFEYVGKTDEYALYRINFK